MLNHYYSTDAHKIQSTCSSFEANFTQFACPYTLLGSLQAFVCGSPRVSFHPARIDEGLQLVMERTGPITKVRMNTYPVGGNGDCPIKLKVHSNLYSPVLRNEKPIWE